MAHIEKFLGKRVEIPEDRRYAAKQGLWAKEDNRELVFGLSEPALVLCGGLKDLEWLVADGQQVREAEAVVFAITGKILYIDLPVGGTIHFNAESRQRPSLVTEDPYGQGWLFRIEPEVEIEGALEKLVGALEYAEGLKSTEGYKNPDGLKGGVSGICKAVYTGIGEQKI